MALIKCTECDREVSDKASSCPGCGSPIAATPETTKPVRVKTSEDNFMTRSRGCADVLLILFVILILFLIFVFAL